MSDLKQISTPCFILDENSLLKNLKTISKLSGATGIKFLLALKAFSTFPIFPLLRTHLVGVTCSSLDEVILGREEFGGEIHAYCPVFLPDEFDQISKQVSHLVFNSLSQWDRYKSRINPSAISCGLRINPRHSVSTRSHYDPCAEGSRFGIGIDELKELPAGIEGLHFHVHCENTSVQSLVETLHVVEKRFSAVLKNLKWLNMGGGLVITDDKFEVEEFIALMKSFKQRYPDLELYMEPGAAIVWNSGYLLTRVVDILQTEGAPTAVLDVSFEAHLTDTLLGWRPTVRGAHDLSPGGNDKWIYRLGGISCAACDVLEPYAFSGSLKEGDEVIIEDAMHYTMVKTTCFCGTRPPSIAVLHKDGSFEVYKTFGHADYKNRLG